MFPDRVIVPQASKWCPD